MALIQGLFNVLAPIFRLAVCCVDGVCNFSGLFLDVCNNLIYFVSALSRICGKFPDLVSNDSKTPAVFSGSCCFDSCI